MSANPIGALCTAIHDLVAEALAQGWLRRRRAETRCAQEDSMIPQAFGRILQALVREGEPELAEMLELDWCPNINAARRRAEKQGRASRYYAHVDHRPNTICVAEDLKERTVHIVYGVLVHEVGHLLADWYDVEATPEEAKRAELVYGYGIRAPEEAEANAAAREVLGVTVHYGPDKVQYLTEDDLEKVEAR